jgi:thioredoxin 1
MIERLVIVLLLGILGLLAYQGVLRGQKRRAKTASQEMKSLEFNIPTIVYFTTPSCGPCILQQTPILKQLQADLGEDQLRLIKIDAQAEPETAAQWGVLSVPTVFILDDAGEPRQVFNGVVGIDRLKQELYAFSD